MKTRWKIMLLCIAAGLGTAVIAGLLATRDIPPPDVSDLALDFVDVPAEQNGHKLLTAATTALVLPAHHAPDQQLPDWEASDPEKIQRILASNTRALELAQQAAACQAIVFPDAAGPEDYLTMASCKFNNVRVLLEWKIRSDVLAGRYHDAVGACCTLLNLGKLLQQHANGYLTHIIAMGYIAPALGQAQELARNPAIPAAELNRLGLALSQYGSSLLPGFIRATKGNFALSLKWVDQVAIQNQPAIAMIPESRWIGNKLLRSYALQPNRTTLALAEHHRETINKANRHDTTCTAASNRASKPLVLMALRRNSIGNTITQIQSHLFSNLAAPLPHTECELAGTRLVVACNAYHRTHNRWPAQLQDLVPLYLSAIPTSPLGDPFHYDPAAPELYAEHKDDAAEPATPHISSYWPDFPLTKQAADALKAD